MLCKTMGGFFGAVSKEDCVFDLFFGVDYHSHLGTRRAGMAVYDSESGFDKAIHNIENAPFRTKFTKESNSMHGQMGIGCISDFEAQPILIRSHHGTYAISTVGKINNIDEIADEIIKILMKSAHEMGKSVIVVTHSKKIADAADVVLKIHEGKLYHLV